jgi:MFS family permease
MAEAAALQDVSGFAPPDRARVSPRQVAAVVVGNGLEFYDFLTYSFFAAQIGRTFFPSHDAHASLLASLATFGAGFLTRPVGAFVIGRLADRAGRKPAMLLSFGLMGLAIIGLALTPSYRMIGMAAPIVAIGLRLIQGFALGGEVGPSTAFLIEAAPPGGRGVLVSLQYVGQFTAVMAAGLIGVGLSHIMNAAQLNDFGWRLAFLAGAIIVPFGLLLRQGLIETLDDPERVPARIEAAGAAGIRPYLMVSVLALVLFAAGTTVTYSLNYLTTYASETLHMAAELSFGATVSVGLAGVVFAPIGGWLSDRFGRKPVTLTAWTVLLIAILPGYTGLAHFRSALALFALAGGLSASPTSRAPRFSRRSPNPCPNGCGPAAWR